MALGEYTSVTTANEQIDSEVRVERRSFRAHPQAEQAELANTLVELGMSEKTAQAAADEIHRDENQAVNFHLVRELGLDPREKPSATLAASASFLMFAVGAVIPLIPYLLGYGMLWMRCGVRWPRPASRGRAHRPVHPQTGVVGRGPAAAVRRGRRRRYVCAGSAGGVADVTRRRAGRSR